MCDLTNFGSVGDTVVRHTILFPSLHGGAGINRSDMILVLLGVGFIVLTINAVLGILETRNKK